MTDKKLMIRSCLLYEFKLGTNASSASRRICTTFGKGAVSERTARNWFQKFRSGNEALEDEPRAGRPILLNNDDLKAAIETDSSLTCHELAYGFLVSDETIRLHLHQLGKRLKMSRWVPYELTPANKMQRLTICSSHLSRQKREPIFDRIMTCDEKWIMYTNFKRKHHWLSPGDHLPQTSKGPLFQKKLLLCVWWTCQGIIHYEFLKTGETINANKYCEQLVRVQENLLKKQPALVNRRQVLFLQDNARPHVAKITLAKITELNWEIMPHPPYSPDLSPTDFHLFLSLDNHMKNRAFNIEEDLKMEIQNFFQSKTKDFFKNGITKLLNRWEKVIACEGSYFDE